MTKTPCRLYVILAREAPIGVIIRRGPSKWEQIIKWNTDTDTFEEGQWFHGRIYHERCDVSPDGSKFIYGTYKVGGNRKNPDIYSGWTAISTPPYLTALVIWDRSYYWNGGLFLTNQQITLPRQLTPPNHGSIPTNVHTSELDIDYDRNNAIELKRLSEYGWLINEMDEGVKKIPQSDYSLTFVYNEKLHSKVYRLLRADGSLIPLNRVFWADCNQRGRLVFSRDGKLFTADPSEDIEHQAIELADFNGNMFTDTEAPEWAMQW